jgi:threonine dehydratase
MITLDDFNRARRRISAVAFRTPLIPYLPPAASPSGKDNGRQIYLKAESLQLMGSFKIRGAYNKIASLTSEQRRAGVIAYSSGNHAQGVACAARALGVRAVVVMPGNAPKLKIENTERLGAEIVLVGPSSNERHQKAEELAAEHGYVIIPSFNDEQIIAGQGTVGLELLEDLNDADLVLAPVGGGGLVSGISAVVKLSGSRAKVVGVEPELANDAQQSFRAHRIVQIDAQRASSTIADGLRVQSLGQLTFEYIERFVDDIVTVSEDDIRRAMQLLIGQARIIAEPSGAVAFAAALLHADQMPPARRIVAVVSGGNCDPHLLAQIVDPQGVKEGMTSAVETTL